MSSETSNQELLRAWKSGDHDAAAEIYHRYQIRLLALVRSRLSRKLARRVDAEDILLSAYRSFFVGAQNGRYTPTDGDDLWPLLTTIVLRKLARQARYHQAECRSIDGEQSDESGLIESLITHQPTADHAAILTDEIEQLMNQLDETAREVFVRTLQGSDINSIANELGLHERTVRRAVDRIRQLLRPATTESSSFSILPIKTHSKDSGAGETKNNFAGNGDAAAITLLKRSRGSRSYSASGVDGQITLCDFGLSRHATDPEDVPRGGTAGFLAPEQISDEFGPVTMLTDVYGFGGLFYALLTGRPPMTGRDLPEILANVLSQKLPEAPSQAVTKVSSQLDALILFDPLILCCLRKGTMTAIPLDAKIRRWLRWRI